MLPEIVREEKGLALSLLKLARIDPRIGFEASNHYFYSLQGLLEKIVQCDFLLEKLKTNR